jgi:hypothetical protein
MVFINRPIVVVIEKPVRMIVIVKVIASAREGDARNGGVSLWNPN